MIKNWIQGFFNWLILTYSTLGAGWLVYYAFSNVKEYAGWLSALIFVCGLLASIAFTICVFLIGIVYSPDEED